MLSSSIFVRFASPRFTSCVSALRKVKSEAMSSNFTTLAVTRVGKNNNIAHVELNRPDKGNAMNPAFFTEYAQCFAELAKDTSYRAIVVSARGKYFSVGLDLKATALGLGGKDESNADVARKAYKMYSGLLQAQNMVTNMEKCPQPVIYCMHSVCLGGAVNLACGADIRFCTKDAWFSIKEVDIGIAADVGALQRIERVIGSSSIARDLCYTARKMYADEAKSCGFVSDVLDTQEACVQRGMEMAENIASKSPVAIAGTKIVLNYSRDHTVADSLHFQSAWNGVMNQTEDIKTAMVASLNKQDQPVFPKL